MARSYFWQGGRRIEVEEDAADITLHARDAAEAREVAARAGVEVAAARLAAPGLVRATIVPERDAGMAKLRTEAIVHHVYRDTGDSRSEYLITDSFFVQFKPGTPASRITQYIVDEHLAIEQDFGRGLMLLRVTDETARNPIRTANLTDGLDYVQYAEPNLVRQLERFHIPADTLFPRQWHLHAPQAQEPDLVEGAGIFVTAAWDLTRGSRDIVVCVADDGFDLSHPDFVGASKIAGRWNLVPRGSTLAMDDDVSPRPGDYHGTPCAGVAIAESDGRGVVGVAPGCSFLAVRFPLSMSDQHFLLMFERISRVADVMSCSWGYGPADAPMSSALRDRLAEIARTGGRRGKGLVICVAAGNNNCPIQDLDNTRTYEFFSAGRIQRHSGPIDRWIAAHPDVITVSACTSRKTRSAYSSWGAEVSVCAPSDNWDDLRRVETVGRGVVTTDNEGFGDGTDFTPNSRFTENFGGTSSATPTVAGVAALVLSRNPSLSAAEVKDLLQRTADKSLTIASETAVNVPGDFADGVSPWFGHGKVHAARAVQAALPAATSEIVSRVQANEVPIPDTGVPILSAIDIVEAGDVAALRLHVDVRHPYRGDLEIALVAPDGTTIVLHDHAGGSADDVTRTYTHGNLPALRALLGRPVAGRWQLRIVDTLRADVGVLERWVFAATLTNRPARVVAAPDDGREGRMTPTSYGAAQAPPRT